MADISKGILARPNLLWQGNSRDQNFIEKNGDALYYPLFL